MEMDPEDIPRAGLEEMRRAGTCCGSGSGRLERAMELDLEGNLEAGFEDLRKVEAGSEAGSGRHS